MLTQHQMYQDVKFDNSKISPDTVTALLEMGNVVDDEVMLGAKILDIYKETRIETETIELPDDDEVNSLVKQAIDDMKTDPDLKKDLESQTPEKITELKNIMSAALSSGLNKYDNSVSVECVDYDTALKEFINHQDKGDTTEVYLDGELVMEVTGANRTTTKKAIQAFFVVMDVLFLVYAILSMPQCKPTKDAIEKLIQEFGKKISNAANQFISALSSVFQKLRNAHASGTSAFMTAVKNAAKTIGNAVVTCVKFLWENKKGLSLLKKITTAVFKAATGSVWKALYYVGQFVLGIISLIAGPAAMVAKVANLISALAALIVDSIDLANMSQEQATENVA